MDFFKASPARGTILEVSGIQKDLEHLVLLQSSRRQQRSGHWGPSSKGLELLKLKFLKA